MSKLAVIIVSWNTCELTRNCLISLLADMRDIDNEIWVVDNDSSDSSAEMVKNEFPHVRLIVNSENIGFARANNQALRKASGEYSLLLNSDTIVPDGLMGALCDFMDSNPDAGAAGPRQIDGTGNAIRLPKKLPSLSGELLDCMTYHFLPFGQMVGAIRRELRRDIDEGRSPEQVELLSAACLIIRKSVIDRIGYLSEEFFLFSEENDYFTRMKQSGFKAYFLPGLEITHLVGKSRAKRGNADSELNFFRSRLKYFGKFYRWRAVVFKAIYYFFFGWSLAMAWISSGLKGRGRSDYLETYSALWRILRKEGRTPFR